jgi:hypothetical protein
MEDEINKILTEIRLQYDKQFKRSLLSIERPLLFYRFTSQSALNRFIATHNLDDVDFRILVTPEQLDEIEEKSAHNSKYYYLEKEIVILT